MKFYIKFKKNHSINDLNSELEKVGEIKMGDHHETFIIPISYWTQKDYEEQWYQAFGEILSSEESSSALITAMHDPSYTDYITSWPMYRSGKHIYIQNKLILTKDIAGIFDINNLREYVGNHETITDEGDIISEWKVDIDDLKKAIDRIHSGDKN